MDTSNKEPTFNQIHLAACLALHQNRRYMALGLTHVTTRTRGLLWYYNTLQHVSVESYQDLMLKSFHLGVIRGARKRMRQIRKAIKLTTPIEKARTLYHEYTILQEAFNKSVEVINA